MSDDRQPYQFKQCMSWALYDIRGIWKAYFIGEITEQPGYPIKGRKIRVPDPKRTRCSWEGLPNEIKSVLLQIKHGVFDQGK